jgi:NADH-quinone oxidoreductase subunit N
LDFGLILPELIVAGTGIAALLLDLFLAPTPERKKGTPGRGWAIASDAAAPGRGRAIASDAAPAKSAPAEGAAARRTADPAGKHRAAPDPTAKRRAVGYLSLAGLAAALVFAVRLVAVAQSGPNGGAPVITGPLAGMLVVDLLAVLLKVTFIAVGIGVSLLGVDFALKRGLPVGEFFALTLFAVLGMMLMAASRDLIMIYLGLETTAISCYALAGLLRGDPKSGEAALKYFLTGALASAIILFGMALVYGGTGTTNLSALPGHGAVLLGEGGLFPQAKPIALVGLVMLIAGFGFKLAAVPFHFWAPDAYEGAPTPVTAFFSVGPKAAAFAAALRIFGPVLMISGPARAGGPTSTVLALLFTILAVVTMTVGNLTAMSQKNIKRMLAYSSIAHAGYLMVGFAVASPLGYAAMIYYLLAYAATNLGVFAVVIWLNNRGTGDDISDYAGLGRRAPLAALAMVICFLSLIGIPPTAGFFGKFYLFLAAIGGGMTWLAVVMVINTAISVGYYYGVVRQLYLVGAGTRSEGVAAGASPAGVSGDGVAAGEAVAVSTPGEAVPAAVSAAVPVAVATTPVKGTPLVGLALGIAVAAILVLGFLFEPLARLAGLAGVGL